MPFPSDWVMYPDGSMGPPGSKHPPGTRNPQWMPEGTPESPGEVEAIPTLYNDITYRSRSEARWAVLFDNLGLKHMYEPQVVDTPRGRYLPDFYLPTQGCWVEVKGPHPTWEERDKAMSLAKTSGRPAYIFSCGIPLIGADGVPRYQCETEYREHTWRFDAEGNEATGFMFGVKECCGKLGIVLSPLTNLIRCGCGPSDYDPGYLYSFQLAFQKARLRRFV